MSVNNFVGVVKKINQKPGRGGSVGVNIIFDEKGPTGHNMFGCGFVPAGTDVPFNVGDTVEFEYTVSGTGFANVSNGIDGISKSAKAPSVSAPSNSGGGGRTYGTSGGFPMAPDAYERSLRIHQSHLVAERLLDRFDIKQFEKSPGDALWLVVRAADVLSRHCCGDYDMDDGNDLLQLASDIATIQDWFDQRTSETPAEDKPRSRRVPVKDKE